MGVREGVDGVLGAVPDAALGRQDGHVLVGGAAGAAEVGEAEAVDPGVRVGVPAAGLDGVGAGVGAPLDHPERRVGAGELAHGARVDGPGAGAVEGVDQCRRVGEGGGGRWLCPGGRADRRESGRPRSACHYEHGAQHGSSHRGSTASHRADGSRRAVVPSGLECAPRGTLRGDSILPPWLARCPPPTSGAPSHRVGSSKTVLAKHGSAPRRSGARSFGCQPFPRAGTIRHGRKARKRCREERRRSRPARRSPRGLGSEFPSPGAVLAYGEPRRPHISTRCWGTWSPDTPDEPEFVQAVTEVVQCIVPCSSNIRSTARPGSWRGAGHHGSPASDTRYPRSCHTTLACSTHGCMDLR